MALLFVALVWAAAATYSLWLAKRKDRTKNGMLKRMEKKKKEKEKKEKKEKEEKKKKKKTYTHQQANKKLKNCISSTFFSSV